MDLFGFEPEFIPGQEHPDEIVRRISFYIHCHFGVMEAVGIRSDWRRAWEIIFADAIGGEDKAGDDLLADIVKGTCGWSVKTSGSERRSPSLKAGAHFNYGALTLNVMAEHLGQDTLFGSDLASDPNELGQIITERGLKRVKGSKEQQRIETLREAFLLRNDKKGEFVFFDREFEFPSDLNWVWGKALGSVHGYVGDEKVATFSEKGHRLDMFSRIPDDAVFFSVIGDHIPKELVDVIEQLKEIVKAHEF